MSEPWLEATGSGTPGFATSRALPITESNYWRMSKGDVPTMQNIEADAPRRKFFDRDDYASEINEKLAGRVNALAKNVDWQPGQVQRFWDMQGDVFDKLDEGFIEMRRAKVSKAKASKIAAELEAFTDRRIAEYVRNEALLKAEREFEETELRRLALEQFPDLAEKDFIIVGGNVWSCAGEPDDEPPADKPTNGNGHDTTAKPKKTVSNEYDHDPGGDEQMREMRGDWKPPHYDLFSAFAVPALEPRYIHEKYRDIVLSNAKSNGQDAGALWESIVCAWSSIIPANGIRIKPISHNEKWREASRLATVICGEAGTGKSPVMAAAVDPLIELDVAEGKQYALAQKEYIEKTKEERAEMDEPKRVTVVTDADNSIEGLQDVAFDNERGFLLFSDEFRAVYDMATRFATNGSNHTGRAFTLKALDSAFAKTIRKNGEKSGYPSYSILGSIQPKVLHLLASDADNDDGMAHRLNVIFINKEALPKKSNEPPSHPMKLHDDMIKAAYRLLTYQAQTITFSKKADVIRQKMDDWIEEQRKAYEYGNPALAMGLLKWGGYFARRCLIMHTISHYDTKPTMPSTVSAEIAHQVFTYMTEYLFEHTKAFYSLAGANDEHEILRLILEHALVHRLETFTANDLAHGSRQLAKIDRRDLKRFMFKLEALGYAKVLRDPIGPKSKRQRYDSVALEMNPYLFTQNVELAKKLRDRNAAWVERWKAARERKANDS